MRCGTPICRCQFFEEFCFLNPISDFADVVKYLLTCFVRKRIKEIYSVLQSYQLKKRLFHTWRCFLQRYTKSTYIETSGFRFCSIKQK